jgi:hypothetical protein
VSFILTNRSECIRFKGDELVSSNEPISNEGFVLALEVASWRDDASLLQVILGGGGGALCFQLWKSADKFGHSNSSNKVISGNLVKFTSISNFSDHCIMPYRFCDSGSSVFQVCKLVAYNK